MSTTQQKPDTKQDKSDVLSLLLNIKRLYTSYSSVLNDYTRTTLLLSLSLEAQMLADKLRIMNKRWQIHLPFKEACAVDFFDWSKTIACMAQSISEPDSKNGSEKKASEYCPSKHFALDLYEHLRTKQPDSGHAPYYQEVNIPAFLDKQDKIRRQISLKWLAYKELFSRATAEEIDSSIGDVLLPLQAKHDTIRQTCSDTLRQLSAELFHLNDILTGVFTRDQLIRLSERVLAEDEYRCIEAERAAEHYPATIVNTSPESEWEQLFESKIQNAAKEISQQKYGNSISRYIGESIHLEGHYHGFGRFLNNVRRDIAPEDLRLLMKYLYRIQYLRKEAKKLGNSTQAEEETPASHAPQAALPPSLSSTGKNAYDMYRLRLATSPKRPPLPQFFISELATSPRNTAEFYRILHAIGFYTGRYLTSEEKHSKKAREYEGWKWSHLYLAFGTNKARDKEKNKLGIISDATSYKKFAEFLAEVFPYLKPDNLIRNYTREQQGDPVRQKNIIAKIAAEFAPLTSLIRQQQSEG